MVQSPETLLKNMWEYSCIATVNNMTRIKRFYKETQETPLTLSIMADSKEEFNRITYGLHKAFERDVRSVKPGKLWWNDFYKEVFVFASAPEEFEELYEAVEMNLTLVSTYPFWVRKTTFNYFAFDGSTGALDYPIDYGFDYDVSDYQEVIQNDFISDANFNIIFYGPCMDPSIMINEHVYEIFMDLGENEYIVVDSLNKKITHFTGDGTVSNIFYLRNKESDIFQKIASGTSYIGRNKSIGVDIILFDERGEPEWI